MGFHGLCKDCKSAVYGVGLGDQVSGFRPPNLTFVASKGGSDWDRFVGSLVRKMRSYSLHEVIATH